MGPLSKLMRLAPCLLILGCDTVATRAAAPTAVLAAAPAADTKAARRAERQAEKAAKAEQAKQGEPAKPGKAEKAAKAGQGVKSPAPAKPVTPAKPTASGAPLPACPQDNALSYRSFGAGFLRTWCTDCHSSTLAAADRQDAPGDVNFDRPDFYKLQERLVYERAVQEGHKFATDPASASPMPPAGLVPAADLRRLGQWIACGSPGA